uniref:Methyltransferase domain-containing protein n=1 Tax=Schlesneria paludicola TaxID=360056 RepID=A0A7C2JYH8_9PLAN
MNSEYTHRFFEDISSGSMRSAQIIAPLVHSLAPVTSVLDVGCGTGAWLRAFQECGVTVLSGLDGEYVDRSQLLIDHRLFTPCDLQRATSLPTGFDLVVCLEVLEHLPNSAGLRLVSLMTQSAPLILFSAAMPGQGGTHHINERWHEHWHLEFLKHGYATIDCIREKVFAERQVAPWFRQNIFLYAAPDAYNKYPHLLTLREAKAPGVVPICPHVLRQFTSTRGLVRALLRHLVRQICG